MLRCHGSSTVMRACRSCSSGAAWRACHIRYVHAKVQQQAVSATSIQQATQRERACTKTEQTTCEIEAAGSKGYDSSRILIDGTNAKRRKEKTLVEQKLWDGRIWPIAGMMLVCGLSVGMVAPAYPIISVQLGLTPTQFGCVTSAFALSKLLANLPAGLCNDTYGRRASMAGGLAVVTLGMIGTSVAASLSSLSALAASRLCTGVGASFVLSGATTAALDLGTAVNRTRVLAPVLQAFSAGSVLGPAVGGVLISTLGIVPAFGLVSGIFALNSVGTYIWISETKPKQVHAAAETSLGQFQSMIQNWYPILANSEIRSVIGLNIVFGLAMTGGQATLLPLLLANHFGLGPAEIGTVFALQAAVGVAVASPMAAAADRFGPQRVLAPSLLVMATGLAALPVTSSIYEAALPLTLMAVGSTSLSSAPAALVSNLTEPASRAHANALLRTMGDVGSLLGGVGLGGLASLLGSGTAFQGTASLLLATAGCFSIYQKFWHQSCR